MQATKSQSEEISSLCQSRQDESKRQLLPTSPRSLASYDSDEEKGKLYRPLRMFL